MMLFQTVGFIILTSVFCIVWCCILTESDNILGFVRIWINKLTQKEWILKVTGGCAVCFSGQLSLWLYPIVFYLFLGTYHVILHITAVVFVIFITDQLEKAGNYE